MTTSDCLSHSEDHFDNEVSIKGQGLKLDDANSCENVMKMINSTSKLEVLRLEGNSIGTEAAKWIGVALESHCELQRLIMNDCFTGRLKEEIPMALDNLFDGLHKSKAKLIELNLSDNAFGPIGMASLTRFLRSPCCHELEILRLHNNGLGIDGAKSLANGLRSLAKQVKKLPLKVLICGRNRLEDEGSEAVADALKMGESLTEIQIPQNGIRPTGIMAMISAMVMHNKNIKLISFNDNTVCVDGAEFISNILPDLEYLEELNLGDCLLQSEGAMLIAQSVANMKTLKRINMSSNEIDASSVKQILDCLNLPLMNLINLDDNDVSSNKAKDILSNVSKQNEELKISMTCLEVDEEDEDAYSTGEDSGDDLSKGAIKIPATPSFVWSPCIGGGSNKPTSSTAGKKLFGTSADVSFSRNDSFGSPSPFSKLPGSESSRFTFSSPQPLSSRSIGPSGPATGPSDIVPSIFDSSSKASWSTPGLSQPSAGNIFRRGDKETQKFGIFGKGMSTPEKLTTSSKAESSSEVPLNLIGSRSMTGMFRHAAMPGNIAASEKKPTAVGSSFWSKQSDGSKKIDEMLRMSEKQQGVTLTSMSTKSINAKVNPKLATDKTSSPSSLLESSSVDDRNLSTSVFAGDLVSKDLKQFSEKSGSSSKSNTRSGFSFEKLTPSSASRGFVFGNIGKTSEPQAVNSALNDLKTMFPSDTKTSFAGTDFTSQLRSAIESIDEKDSPTSHQTSNDDSNDADLTDNRSFEVDELGEIDYKEALRLMKAHFQRYSDRRDLIVYFRSLVNFSTLWTLDKSSRMDIESFIAETVIRLAPTLPANKDVVANALVTSAGSWHPEAAAIKEKFLREVLLTHFDQSIQNSSKLLFANRPKLAVNATLAFPAGSASGNS